ncbi:pseudouridine synthase [Pleurotus eryngii]|uniref:Pseudouridine synthase n=1 Tax=Pleurotus eryngii TaxID=5323 RepID=A0A9P6A188_PLEER|nr:pseudouridine synthase [Pleurotus eryngii]
MAEDDVRRPTKRSKIDHGPSPTATINDDVMQSDDTSMAREPEASSSSAVAVELAPTKKPEKGKRRDASGWARSRRGRDSDKKNVGRKRRGTRNDEARAEGTEGACEGSSVAPKGPRYPKRQCALLLSFCGTGCSGMQIQPNVRTIEGVLFDALVKAGAVSEDNADDPVKVNLARAARTDAGVHAAGNVVSLKMITSRPDVPDILARVNEELPPEIRLWGYVRVQNSFNPRTLCDSRKYTYFFPSYLLIPPRPGSNLMRSLQKYAEDSNADDMTSTHSFWDGVDLAAELLQDTLTRKRLWRVPSDQVDGLRSIVTKFLGTHNFHNFTVGKEVNERSNFRHMKAIEISDPAVYGETEWISVLFHGQSFMLHQRKMMAALVLSCRTGAPASIIDELYGNQSVLIPKMPSLGLLLEYPIFETYNSKVTNEINKNLDPSHEGYRPSIDFELYKDQIARFKQTHIYDNMRKIEDQFGIFDAWIRSVDKYGGDDLLYLNHRGIIPPESVVAKGRRRENPFKEHKRFDATAFPSDVKDGAFIKEDEESGGEEGVNEVEQQLSDAEG